MGRILVVDDEISEIDALSEILMPNHDVIVAKSGKAAIDKAHKHLPDLILLDVIMPDMTGFETIVQLKNSEVTHRIPVIFITSLDEGENEEKGLLLGAVDYITKPFSSAIVKARVHTHLQIVEYINKIEHLCKVDALTNVANRRYLDNQIIIEWKQAIREEKSIGFIMIDIDFFKKYNDRYGHPQGDVLLKSVAAIFAGSLNRPADFVARWGGEEFAVILPGSDLKGTMEVAERIRAEVESAIVPCTDGTETSVTVSMGANAVIPDHDSDLQLFITMTDEALYKAKTSGRNQVQPA